WYNQTAATNRPPLDFVVNSKWSPATVKLGSLVRKPHVSPPLEDVQKLLEAGADPNAVHVYSRVFYSSNSWVFNEADCVWHPPEQGDLNVKPHDKWTPLTRAANR